MNLETLRTHLLTFPATTEETPFTPETLVYKVHGKAFALVGWQLEPLRINLKCDPARALQLRDEYEAIQPGYHMNKKHWNSVFLDGTIDDQLLKELIQDSFDLVVKSLPKSTRDELANTKSD
ncbi:MAG: MmcQ/YjbR family DNA-binding protein [Caldilineaceae bacterium]